MERDSGLPSRQIYVNSEDAMEYIDGKTSNIQFFFKDTLVCPKNCLMHISVVSAEIPVSYYLVNDNNNRFTYEFNGTEYTLFITKKNYNITQLKDFFNSSSLNSTHGVSVTYSATTNKLSFTCTNSTDTFTIKSTSTCQYLIGFSRGTDHTSSSGVLISNNVVDLSGINAIYIVSNLPTSNIDSRNKGFSPILGKIPVNSGYNGIISFNPAVPHHMHLQQQVFNFLHLTLENQNMQIIDLNGLHWQMTLNIHFLYKEEYDPERGSTISTLPDPVSLPSTEIYTHDLKMKEDEIQKEKQDSISK
jgi:hypothetical protein